MSLINCAECGKEISDKAKSCPNCGFPLKKKGGGFAVASLVLGIIACVYSVAGMTSLVQSGIKINALIFLLIYVMMFAILSLIFGIASHCRGCKLKKKVAGITLSVISIVILLCTIFIHIL